MNIGIDFDDVITPSIETFLEWYNKNNNTNIHMKHYMEYKTQMPHIKTLEEYCQLWWDFYATEEHHAMIPKENVIEILQKLNKKHDLHIITSRDEKIQKHTYKWIENNLKGIFKEIVHIEYFYDENKNEYSHLTKADICKKLGIQIFIDDSISNLLSCVNENIKCILFQPNTFYDKEELSKVPSTIIKVNSWKEIEKEIEKLEKNQA